MSNVTRKDVIRLLGESAAFDGIGTFAQAERTADALIAVFPHLVGEVEVKTDDADPEARYLAGRPRIRHVYTVTGPWEPVPEGSETA